MIGGVRFQCSDEACCCLAAAVAETLGVAAQRRVEAPVPNLHKFIPVLDV